MNNKGQSALEYLMTYGWALVVIIIVIAALFAFGIFNPPAAGTCSGLNKLLYKDHSLTSGVLTISLANGTGSAIDTISATYTGSCTAATGVATPTNPGLGSDFSLASAALTGCPSSGNYSITSTITYTNIDSGLPHSETATCTGNI